LHAKVAAWLTSLTDASTNELLGVTAEHYERAGDHERAAEFYARAAEHACDRYAHEATLAYADRGLLLVDGGMQPHQLELRWRMLREREHVLGMRGRSTEQRACLDELQALAELLDDDGKRGRVLLWRSFRGLTDDVSLVAALARQAAELGSSSKDETLELHARRQLAIATASLGDLGGASSMAKAALTQARSSGLAIVEMAVLGTLEYIANLQGDLMGALDLALQVLTISRQLHHRTQECGALCGVAFNSFELGDYVTARRNLQEALPLARGLGDRHIEAYALKLLSNVALSEGDKRESLSLAHAALEIAQQAQADEELASALCSLGNAELALGSYQAAAHAFERAASVAAKAGDPFRHDATAGRARAALDGGDLGRASDYVERLLTEYYCDPRMKGAARPALIDLTCWKVLVRLDDPRAPDLLARAHVALQDRAALISDLRLRHGFLNGIQEHQEIVTAWAAQQAQSTGHS
jgi:tetratricopeptide (TPR) repeat protein